MALLFAEIQGSQQVYQQIESYQALYDAVVYDGKHPEVADALPGINELLTSCWSANPTERPDANRVFIVLMGLLDEQGDLSSDESDNEGDLDLALRQRLESRVRGLLTALLCSLLDE